MKKAIFVFLSFFLLVGIVFLGVTIQSVEVSGANNDSLLAKVNVTNSEPTLYNITISPDSIDLTAGNTTQVNCTGLIYDSNGWNDIVAVNATLYDASIGDGITTDDNFRYFNGTCNTSCVQYNGGNNNASCTCTFDVVYYANNGSWQCNMTVADSYDLKDTNNSINYTITSLIGVDVPEDLLYGNLSILEESAYIPKNVTNWGNRPINITVRGFGGDNESIPDVGNLSMICEYGNISWGNQRYSVDNVTPFANMVNLTYNDTYIYPFKLPVRTNDLNYGNDTNTTYWKLYVPSGVSGLCNGTIVFTATETVI